MWLKGTEGFNLDRYWPAADIKLTSDKDKRSTSCFLKPFLLYSNN